MFRNPTSRAQILTAVDAQQCFMIDYRSSSSHFSLPASNGASHIGDNVNGNNNGSSTSPAEVAGLFVINYQDPFDERLWKGFVEDWKDALYLHRLVLQKPFQGVGLTPRIFEFVEQKVRDAGRHYLRLDCLAGNAPLRRLYAEKCRGKGKGGLKELGTIDVPEWQLEFARFEIQVVPRA
ncbi:hypothetical protein EDD21DRAFT_175088 [Dissophora ornata]|nr:hypothetical protein EDD21DRAFT_175088 [Dissophora ornata]